MKRRRNKTCQHCCAKFKPDARNRDKQRYCGAAQCRKASQRKSARHWRKKNPSYHSGPQEVERVRAWRTDHPAYWRRKAAALEADALQDDCTAQHADDQMDNVTLAVFALQDDCTAQAAVIRGLIAHLTDSTLQEDIDRVMREFQKRGRRNPGTLSGCGRQTQTNETYAKTSSQSTAAAARAGAVQLGRSPPRAASSA